jgi:NADPH:quinone reductase-like Zn-dependent oxidoreductase
MKAVSYDRFGGPEVLQYIDLPDPTPGPRQLVVETAAVGVNFPDIRERMGVYNKAETRVGGVQLPQVGGLAVAGTVVAAGSHTSVEVGRAPIGFYLPVFYDEPDLIGNALRFLADGLKSGQITSRADEVLPPSQAAEAHRRLESREVRGVIVLDRLSDPEEECHDK